MRSPDEIKKGLECSIAELLWSINEGCPDEMIDSMENAHARMTDALAHIRQLETENHQLLTKVKQLEEKCHQPEQDAALEFLSETKPCEACKHCKIAICDEPCATCVSSLLVFKPNWERRGVKEE